MNLDTVDINYLAVIVGAIVYYALGFAWYSFIVGDRWLAATGRTREDISGGPGPLIVVFWIAGFIAASVIASVYEWAHGDGLVDGLVVGAILGVGLVMGEGLKKVVFEQDSWELYALNMGYTLLGFLLMGGIYGVIAAS